MANYADGDDMVTRFDVRLLGDLVTDDNTRIAAAAVPADANLGVAITDATERINSALRQANRYTTDDLAQLVTDGDAQLKRICCALAMEHLYQRRGSAIPDGFQVAIDDAKDVLEQIRLGNNVLQVDGAIQSGLPNTNFIQPAERTNLGRAGDAAIFPPDERQKLRG